MRNQTRIFLRMKSHHWCIVRLVEAESVMVGFAEIAEQYLAATGDNDGVTTVGGWKSGLEM